jgi:hypothetical protein
MMPRELIEPHKGDKRYIRRGAKGRFTEKQVDVSRSLSADRRSNAKTVAKKGEGDRGDRRSLLSEMLMNGGGEAMTWEATKGLGD